MTITETRPADATVIDLGSAPSAQEVIDGVRTGHIQPAVAHPATSPWTPVVYVLSAAAGLTGPAAVLAYWHGNNQVGGWTATAGLFLALLALLACRQEWGTR